MMPPRGPARAAYMKELRHQRYDQTAARIARKWLAGDHSYVWNRQLKPQLLVKLMATPLSDSDKKLLKSSAWIDWLALAICLALILLTGSIAVNAIQHARG